MWLKTKFVLINIYAPNKDKDRSKISKQCTSFKTWFQLKRRTIKKIVYLATHSELWTLRESFPVQCKVLNSISFPNTKLFKIGFVTEDKCSFCKSQSETLSHLLFDCIKTSFWRDFEFYFYCLSKEFVHLTLKDVIVGIIITKCPLLNYLLLIAKIYLWDCRRTRILPNITCLLYTSPSPRDA